MLRLVRDLKKHSTGIEHGVDRGVATHGEYAFVFENRRREET